MNGFNETTIGQIITLQRGFDITKKEQTPGEVPIVSSSGVSSYHNVVKVKGPGVVIGRKGTLGTSHYVKQDFWPHDTTLWVKDFKGNDPRFISYFLKTLKLENFDTGSSNPTLNRNHVHKIKVYFPDLRLQRKISGILSAYDELIELNECQVKLIEKYIEEVFQEWFVRFRFPNLKSIKFNKNIPSSWNMGKVSDLVSDENLETGKRPKGGAQKSGVVSVGAENVIGLGRYKFNKEKYVPELFFESMKQGKVKNKDVLFYKDGAEIGRVTLFQNDFPHKKMCVNEHVFILRTEDNIYQNYLYFYFSQPSINEYVHLINKNAAQPGINRNELKNIPLLIPEKEIMEKFNTLIEPSINKLFSLCLMNRKLKQQKDIITNRLVSGKLSVEDLDIQFPPSMLENQ